MKIDYLSQEEIDYILQALLFGSSADIISNWTEEDMSKLLQIAIKIKINIAIQTYAESDKTIESHGINIDTLEITKENNCDNLIKVKLIKEYFDIKEF